MRIKTTRNFTRNTGAMWYKRNIRATRLQRTVVETELLWEISTAYAVSAQTVAQTERWQAAERE